ncbi:MAG: hypothetical protein R6U98_08675, partial [Pirellulaceae bacterium]
RDEVGDVGTEGLFRAGLWIGRLERVLILTFFLLQRFEAIGFLIAAKSIFRFGVPAKKLNIICVKPLRLQKRRGPKLF